MRNQSFFANPSLRAHLLLVTTSFTGFLLVAIAAALFVPLFQRFDATRSYDELGALAQQILDMHAGFWPIVLLSLCACAASSWAIYARLRGPLHRFVAVFRAVAAGAAPAPVVIRATDYVQEECAALNAMLSALGEREARLAQLEQCAAALTEWAQARGDAEACALASELEAACKALRPVGAQ